MVMCWALGCNHYNARETCKFFRFPLNRREYKRWMKLLSREGKPGTGARVCSCHFKDGKRENGPEIFKHNVQKIFQPHHLSPEKKKQRRMGWKSLSSPKNIHEEKDPVPCKETPNVSRIQISNVHTVKDINNTNVIDPSFSSSIEPVPEEEEINFLTEVEDLDNHSDIPSSLPQTQQISPTRTNIKDSSTANTMNSSPGAFTNNVPAMAHVFLLPAGIVSNSNGIVQNVPLMVGQPGQPNNIMYLQPSAVPVAVGTVCSNNFIPVGPGPGNGGQGNLVYHSSNTSNNFVPVGPGPGNGGQGNLVHNSSTTSNNSLPDGNRGRMSFNTSSSAPHSSSRRPTSQISETIVLDDSDYDAGNSSSTLTASDIEGLLDDQKRSFPVYRYFGDCRYEDMDNRLKARKSLELGAHAIQTMRNRFERAQKRNKSLRRDLKCMQDLYRYFVETNFLQNFAEELETEELEKS